MSTAIHVSTGSVDEATRESGASPPLLSIVLLCIAFGLALLTAWGPTFAHLGDAQWATHEKFHAWREIFLASVCSVAGILLCLGPLKRGEPNALMAVGVLGLAVVAGFWAGLPITGIGKAGWEPFANHGLQLAALIAGYVTARSAYRARAA